MVKKATYAYAALGLLVVGGIVAVIVLAVKGVFSKHSAGTPMIPGTNYIPGGTGHTTTCLSPTVNSVQYNPLTGKIDFTFTPLSQDCINMYGGIVTFYVQYYLPNGQEYGGEDSQQQLPAGTDRFSLYSPSSPSPNGDYSTFHGTLYITYGSSFTGPVGDVYKFQYTLPSDSSSRRR